MNTKKILGSIITLGIVGAVVIGASNAFFSDTETSVGNTFVAGAIDLQVDNTSYGFDWNDPNNNEPVGNWGLNQTNSWTLTDLTDELFFDFHDLKPGDYGEDTISLHVNDNDAYACMAFDLTGIPENGLLDPESEAGDESEEEGELQNYLSFLFWWDDGDNVLEDGEIIIEDLAGLPEAAFTGTWLAIAESGDDPLVGGQDYFIGKGWCFGDITAAPVSQADNPSGPTVGNTGFTCSGAEGDHNDAQTDGIVVDVGFYAVQSRNNDQFSCASLPPFEGENGKDGPFVGAALSSYEQPQDCDLTVDDDTGNNPDHTSIQAAVDVAAENSTVCVADGTYDEDVVIDVLGLTLSGDGASATSTINGQSANFGGALVIDADNVTVEGFAINGATGSQHAVRFATGVSGATFRYNAVNAPNGGNALLTQGNQSNHVISNNMLVGDSSPQVAYVNGNASLTQPSDNVDFMNNTFSGTIVSGGLAIGVESTNTDVTRNIFNSTLTSTYAISEFWMDDAMVNENNFHDTTSVQVLNNGANTLNAENNWWGEASPSGHTSGNVDDDPMEASPYPEN